MLVDANSMNSFKNRSDKFDRYLQVDYCFLNHCETYHIIVTIATIVLILVYPWLL